jgi:hypothetical protein
MGGETEARALQHRTWYWSLTHLDELLAEPAGENHHGKLSQPKIKVGILLVQPSHGAVFIRGQSLLSTRPPPRPLRPGQAVMPLPVRIIEFPIERTVVLAAGDRQRNASRHHTRIWSQSSFPPKVTAVS